MNTADVSPGHKVVVVHRVGAVVVALVIATFGVLGFVGGLGFFDTSGSPVLGLSSNGLLSTISIVTALVLIASAARGGRLSSTVMMVVGTLFLVSAFANLAVMATPYNLLAFRLPNVFFSIGAGLVLLILGSYGRVSAKLPDDNPYRAPQPEDERSADPEASLPSRPHTRAEMRADREMAEASRAAVSGAATAEQRRRLAEIDTLRTHEDRRKRWMATEEDLDRGSAMA
ncbi:hypothetical protein GCM10023201_09900 [Actinomycetospora corticicola]|uniref:DUF4383 domain-containing protein n=1 Tax=Actinomycetospora corticicola TaxID=663602 RepID=A0A7Y9DTE9_9PSEU|nr:DUF4383 domain-containing protein [Actinomycetospora corticicola]NYD35173.1 hypothetical protein [Actinomycetospora corticicola]